MDKEILFKYFESKTTQEENERIVAWLDENPSKHTNEVNKLRYIYIATGGGLDRHREESPKQRILPWRRIAIYAGSAAAAFLLVVGARFTTKQEILKDMSNRLVALEAPAGQHIKISLEDGTQVWLNAGAKLDYPVVFDRGIRRVKLSGEAMFEVEHDQRRPFIVETFASEIEVLGTKFNVLADEQSQMFVTSLLQGSVKVVDPHDHQTVYLQPNESVTLVDGCLKKNYIEDPVALQWPEGILSIKGQTFLELMSKFEKAFGVKIRIQRTIMPEIRIKSGKIRVSDGIDHALRVLQLAGDFTYSRNEETNEIVIQ